MNDGGMPGLGAYLAGREHFDRMENSQQARQVTGFNLQAGQRAQQEDAQLRELLAASGGDIEKAVEAAVKSGNVNAAHKLAPLLRLQQERREGQQLQQGLSELYAPTQQAHNPMAPGPGASVMAGSGSTVPPPAPQIDPVAHKQQRRAQLERMSVMYARHPQMQARIQAEMGKLDEELKPAAPAPLSPLGKYISERDKLRALNPNHPDIKTYEQAITKYQPGGVQVNINPGDPLIPGKPAQNKVDEGLLDAGMRLQSLGAIERQFKPEFQEIGTRWNALTLSWRDKSGLDIAKLDPVEKQRLTEFSQYKRNSIDAMNQYIKSVTGAAMTNAEAERILRGLPNPGTGLFDGDSPTEFKAKLDDAMKQVRLAEARLVYIKRNGMNLGDVSLDRMPRVMNERGSEIEALIKKHQPNLSGPDVRKLVKRNLAQEFGLVE